MTLLDVADLVVTRGGRPVLDGIDLTIAPGEMVGLLGPNGAGKTTLIRAALGLQPTGGTIDLGGMPLDRLSRRDIALRAAYLPQDRTIAWNVTVETLVSLGRLPHRTGLAADRAAIADALTAADIAPLRDRLSRELSGGELARALIARALAQEAPLLLADEPAAGLDPAHALGLIDTFRSLARDGRGILLSLHDLGLAARGCDRVVLLDRGHIAADGPPDAVLTAPILARVFGITAHIDRDASGPIVQPTGLARA